MPLRQHLNELASSFTSSLLAAIRGASLEDLLTASSGCGAPVRAAPSSAIARTGPARRRGGRLPRRSATDISRVVEDIVGLLRQTPEGLRAEQIRQRLGLQAKEMPRPLKEALDSGRLGKSGQKRATTYSLNGGGGAAKKATGRGSPRGQAGEARGGQAASGKRTRRASAARARGAKGAPKPAARR